jgi:branched-chain amino acid transport system substrate-binding protein
MASRNRSITRRCFVRAAAVGLGATAAPALLKAQDKKPIRIGGSMSMTGRYSREAMYCVEGYRLWAKHINEMGYSYGNEHLPHAGPGLIDGQKVEMTILDDASDPTTGARLMSHLISGEKVDLLLGAYAARSRSPPVRSSRRHRSQPRPLLHLRRTSGLDRI